jgi:hypothetical protein
MPLAARTLSRSLFAIKKLSEVDVGSPALGSEEGKQILQQMDRDARQWLSTPVSSPSSVASTPDLQPSEFTLQDRRRSDDDGELGKSSVTMQPPPFLRPDSVSDPVAQTFQFQSASSQCPTGAGDTDDEAATGCLSRQSPRVPSAESTPPEDDVLVLEQSSPRSSPSIAPLSLPPTVTEFALNADSIRIVVPAEERMPPLGRVVRRMGERIDALEEVVRQERDARLEMERIVTAMIRAQQQSTAEHDRIDAGIPAAVAVHVDAPNTQIEPERPVIAAVQHSDTHPKACCVLL